MLNVERSEIPTFGKVKSLEAGRKIISFMHISLDGFVAGPKGERNSIMKKLFFLLPALLFFTACERSETLTKSDIEDIRLTMQQYREAWKAGDSANVLSRVCDDIILYMPNKTGKPKIGKDSVTAFWFPPSDVSYPIDAYEITDEKIEGSGNLCVYTGVSKLRWHMMKGNVHSDTTTSVSEFLNVLKKVNDEWKLYRVMYNLKNQDYQ